MRSSRGESKEASGRASRDGLKSRETAGTVPRVAAAAGSDDSTTIVGMEASGGPTLLDVADRDGELPDLALVLGPESVQELAALWRAAG